MAAGIERTLTREQRGAVYEAIGADVEGSCDFDPTQLEPGDRQRLREALRALEDLGWNEDDPRDLPDRFPVTPAVERAVGRLRDEAAEEVEWFRDRLRNPCWPRYCESADEYALWVDMWREDSGHQLDRLRFCDALLGEEAS